MLSQGLTASLDLTPTPDGSVRGTLGLDELRLYDPTQPDSLTPLNPAVPGEGSRGGGVYGTVDESTGRFSVSGSYQVGTTTVPVTVTGVFPPPSANANRSGSPENLDRSASIFTITISGTNFSSYQGTPYVFAERYFLDPRDTY